MSWAWRIRYPSSRLNRSDCGTPLMLMRGHAPVALSEAHLFSSVQTVLDKPFNRVCLRHAARKALIFAST